MLSVGLRRWHFLSWIYSSRHYPFLLSVDPVIGAVAAPWFIHENEEYWDAAHMAEHTCYVQDRIGVEHASFGFDFMDFFTGYEEAYVKGLKDASQAQNIVHELRKISISDTDLEKICYKNAIKILKTAFN